MKVIPGSEANDGTQRREQGKSPDYNLHQSWTIDQIMMKANASPNSVGTCFPRSANTAFSHTLFRQFHSSATEAES